MELSDAIEKANRILDEELSSPTMKYVLRIKEQAPTDTLGQLVTVMEKVNEPQLLRSIKSQRPRHVGEDPKRWALESVNYNLLCALFSQLPEGSRQFFLSAVLGRLSRPPECPKVKVHTVPPWNGSGSEFPLVIEFCIRNGAKRDFLSVLGRLDLVSGHVMMLRHVEDMIALNFTVLADQDYEALTMVITAVGHTARSRYKAHREGGAAGDGESAQFWTEIIGAIDGIIEECRKARYFYLKGALLEGLNLEVNQDKAAVENYLKAHGFSDGLVEYLNRTDQFYQSASSGFEFKSVMGHLRSFMERLQAEGIAKLGPAKASPPPQRWGDGLKHLQQQGLLSKAEEGYAAALFTLLSDAGVHPIIAEKEYARLARNVVIEYALLFLCRLEKRGPRTC